LQRLLTNTTGFVYGGRLFLEKHRSRRPTCFPGLQTVCWCSPRREALVFSSMCNIKVALGLCDEEEEVQQ
jgi:hypothetical protein